DLVEQLLAGVDVVVGALVGAADDHDHEAAVPEHLVADRRLEQVAVVLDPALQVERGQKRHGGPPFRREKEESRKHERTKTRKKTERMELPGFKPRAETLLALSLFSFFFFVFSSFRVFVIPLDYALWRRKSSRRRANCAACSAVAA